MTWAKMTSKGQVTVPKSVRDALHLRSGDRVDFQVVREGEARVVAVTRSPGEVYGMLSRKNRKALSVEAVDRKLAKAFKEKRV